MQQLTPEHIQQEAEKRWLGTYAGSYKRRAFVNGAQWATQQLSSPNIPAEERATGIHSKYMNDKGIYFMCDNCCNKDGCDDKTHYLRSECPHCKGTGINATATMLNAYLTGYKEALQQSPPTIIPHSDPSKWEPVTLDANNPDEKTFIQRGTQQPIRECWVEVPSNFSDFIFNEFKKSFFSKVNLLDDDSCWNWKGHLDLNGYGRVKVFNKNQSAHRMSFVIKNGNIPDDKQVLHKCDNPSCVNPNHLFLGTHQ